MSENTKIEWCDASINWWAGCTQISPACDKCYAKAMAKRLWGVGWGAGVSRHQFHGAAAALHALDRKAKRMGQPLKVFHNSLSDFFDNEVPVQWRIGAMRAIVDTSNLIHLLLTKRIGNAAEMLETAFRAVHEGRQGWADNVPPNVWLGATICNQAEADRDIPKLLVVPAAKRFLSMEPLLGPVDLTSHLWGRATPCADCPKDVDCDCGFMPRNEMLDEPQISWVIVGGESGPNARPMHPDWARSLRDQCEAAGGPFLFKQHGEWREPLTGEEYDTSMGMASKPPAFIISHDGAVRCFQDDRFRSTKVVIKVGKKAAGRLLDGREWNGVPV